MATPAVTAPATIPPTGNQTYVGERTSAYKLLKEQQKIVDHLGAVIDQKDLGTAEKIAPVGEAISGSIADIRRAAEALLKDKNRSGLEEFFTEVYKKYQDVEIEFSVANTILEKFKGVLTSCNASKAPKDAALLEAYNAGAADKEKHLNRLGLLNLTTVGKKDLDFVKKNGGLTEETNKLETLVAKVKEYMESYKTSLNDAAYGLEDLQGTLGFFDKLPSFGASTYFFDRGFVAFKNPPPAPVQASPETSSLVPAPVV